MIKGRLEIIQKNLSDYLSYKDNHNTIQFFFRGQLINKGVESFCKVRLDFSFHCRYSHYNGN